MYIGQKIVKLYTKQKWMLDNCCKISRTKNTAHFSLGTTGKIYTFICYVSILYRGCVPGILGDKNLDSDWGATKH